MDNSKHRCHKVSTLRISDPAPVISGMQLRCDRGVHWIRFVRLAPVKAANSLTSSEYGRISSHVESESIN
jgi:hypothetical protein